MGQNFSYQGANGSFFESEGDTPRVVVPLTGDTVTMLPAERRVFINPAGTIAALTVLLPPNPTVGQEVTLMSTQIVTALTIHDSADAAVSGSLTAMAANIRIDMIYMGAVLGWKNSAIATVSVAAEAVTRGAADDTLTTAVGLASIPAITTVTPTTGQTVTMSAGVRALFVNPAGTIAALTIKFPASPAAGQSVAVAFSQIVTTLTLQDSAAGAIATTAGAVGVSQEYRFIGSAWVKWR